MATMTKNLAASAAVAASCALALLLAAPAAYAADALAAASPAKGAAPAAQASKAKAKASKKIAMKKVKVKKVAKQKYTGKKVKPALKVTYRGKKLKRGRDYTVAYKDNVRPGTAKAIVKGKGKYKGAKTVKFKIWSKGGKRWVETAERVEAGTKTTSIVVSPAKDVVRPQVADKALRKFNNNRCWATDDDPRTLYYDPDADGNKDYYNQIKWRTFDPAYDLVDGKMLLPDEVDWSKHDSVPGVERALDPNVATLKKPELYNYNWGSLLQDSLALNYDVDKFVRWFDSVAETEAELERFREELTAIMDQVKMINETSSAVGNWSDMHEFVITGADAVIHVDAVTKTTSEPVYKTVKTGRWV